MLVAFDLSLRLQLHYSCRQLLANVVIAASRVGSSFGARPRRNGSI